MAIRYYNVSRVVGGLRAHVRMLLADNLLCGGYDYFRDLELRLHLRSDIAKSEAQKFFADDKTARVTTAVMDPPMPFKLEFFKPNMVHVTPDRQQKIR